MMCVMASCLLSEEICLPDRDRAAHALDLPGLHLSAHGSWTWTVDSEHAVQGDAIVNDKASGSLGFLFPRYGPATLWVRYEEDSGQPVDLQPSGHLDYLSIAPGEWTRLHLFPTRDRMGSLHWRQGSQANGRLWIDAVSLSDDAEVSPASAAEAPSEVAFSNQWTGWKSPLAHDGDDFAMLVAPHANDASFQATVTGPGVFRFALRVEAGDGLDPLSFTMNGMERAHHSYHSQAWSTVVHHVPDGEHHLEWRWTQALGPSESVWLDQLSWTPTDPIFQALDSETSLTAFLSSSWTIDMVQSHDGEDSLAIELDGSRPGTIFAWKPSVPSQGQYWCRPEEGTRINLYQGNHLIKSVDGNAWTLVEWTAHPAEEPLEISLYHTVSAQTTSLKANLDQFHVQALTAVSLAEALDAPGFEWTAEPGIEGHIWPSGEGGDMVSSSHGEQIDIGTIVEGPGFVEFTWQGTRQFTINERPMRVRARPGNERYWLGSGEHHLHWRIGGQDSSRSEISFLDAFRFQPSIAVVDVLGFDPGVMLFERGWEIIDGQLQCEGDCGELAFPHLPMGELSYQLNGSTQSWSTDSLYSIWWPDTSAPLTVIDHFHLDRFIHPWAEALEIAPENPHLQLQQSGHHQWEISEDTLSATHPSAKSTVQLRTFTPGLLSVRAKGGTNDPASTLLFTPEITLVDLKPDWSTYHFPVPVAETVVISLEGIGALDSITFQPNFEFEHLNSTIPLEQKGVRSWSVPPDPAGTPSDIAVVQLERDGDFAKLVGEVEGPGRLRFDWFGPPWLTFKVDGIPVASPVYERDPFWQSTEFVIAEGTHQLEWDAQYYWVTDNEPLEHRIRAIDYQAAPYPSSTLAEALDYPDLRYLARSTTGVSTQSLVTLDGEDAVQIQYDSTASTSAPAFFEAEFDGPGMLQYAFRYYGSHGIDVSVSGAPIFDIPLPALGEWRTHAIPLGEGPQRVRWSIRSPSGPSDGYWPMLWIDQLAVMPTPSAIDALDLGDNLTIATAGGPWRYQPHDDSPLGEAVLGVPARQKGDPESWLETTLDGPGLLRFSQKATDRRMRLEVNGQPFFPAYQKGEWESIAVNLSQGVHHIRWLTPLGTSTLLLDAIEWIPGDLFYFETLGLDPHEMTFIALNDHHFLTHDNGWSGNGLHLNEGDYAPAIHFGLREAGTIGFAWKLPFTTTYRPQLSWTLEDEASNMEENFLQFEDTEANTWQFASVAVSSDSRLLTLSYGNITGFHVDCTGFSSASNTSSLAEALDSHYTVESFTSPSAIAFPMTPAHPDFVYLPRSNGLDEASLLIYVPESDTPDQNRTLSFSWKGQGALRTNSGKHHLPKRGQWGSYTKTISGACTVVEFLPSTISSLSLDSFTIGPNSPIAEALDQSDRVVYSNVGAQLVQSPSHDGEDSLYLSPGSSFHADTDPNVLVRYWELSSTSLEWKRYHYLIAWDFSLHSSHGSRWIDRFSQLIRGDSRNAFGMLLEWTAEADQGIWTWYGGTDPGDGALIATETNAENLARTTTTITGPALVTFGYQVRSGTLHVALDHQPLMEAPTEDGIPWRKAHIRVPTGEHVLQFEFQGNIRHDPVTSPRWPAASIVNFKVNYSSGFPMTASLEGADIPIASYGSTLAQRIEDESAEGGDALLVSSSSSTVSLVPPIQQGWMNFRLRGQHLDLWTEGERFTQIAVPANDSWFQVRQFIASDQPIRLRAANGDAFLDTLEFVALDAEVPLEDIANALLNPNVTFTNDVSQPWKGVIFRSPNETSWSGILSPSLESTLNLSIDGPGNLSFEMGGFHASLSMTINGKPLATFRSTNPNPSISIDLPEGTHEITFTVENLHGGGPMESHFVLERFQWDDTRSALTRNLGISNEILAVYYGPNIPSSQGALPATFLPESILAFELKAPKRVEINYQTQNSAWRVKSIPESLDMVYEAILPISSLDQSETLSMDGFPGWVSLKHRNSDHQEFRDHSLLLHSITLDEHPDLLSARDDPSLNFRTHPELPWTAAATTRAYDGIDEFRSAVSSQGESSWIATDVTGPGLLHFVWESSDWQERGNVSIDGESLGGVSDTLQWETGVLSVPAGTHEIRWASPRLLRLDQVHFEPGPNALATALSTQYPFLLTGSDLDWEATNIGETPAITLKRGRLSGIFTDLDEMGVSFWARSESRLSLTEAFMETVNQLSFGRTWERYIVSPAGTDSSAFHLNVLDWSDDLTIGAFTPLAPPGNPVSWEDSLDLDPAFLLTPGTTSLKGLQSDVAPDSEDLLIWNGISDGSNALESEITGPLEIRFDWRVDRGEISFIVNGNRITSTRSPHWQHIVYALPPGQHLCKWRLGSRGRAMMDSIKVIEESQSLRNGLDIEADIPVIFQASSAFAPYYQSDLERRGSDLVIWPHASSSLIQQFQITVNHLPDTFAAVMTKVLDTNGQSIQDWHAVPRHTHDLRWGPVEPSTSGFTYFDRVQLPTESDLNDALDTILPVQSDSDHPPIVLPSALSEDGMDTLDGKRGFVTSIVHGPGLLRFYWKFDDDHARLIWDVNGIPYQVYGEAFPWTQASLELPPGEHFIKWGSANGSWAMDRLSFLPSGTVPGYDSWAASFAEGLQPSQDFNSNGLSNLVAYAFGLSPIDGDPLDLSTNNGSFLGGLPVGTVITEETGDHLILNYLRRRDSSLSYYPYFTSDLTNWESRFEVREITDLANGWERVELLDASPISTTMPRRFGYVQIEYRKP